MDDGVALLTVFVLAGFVGYEVISKVSSTLHTPLMSGSNAISGIVLVGTIVVAATVESPVGLALALLAVGLATVNLVGGFLVTDRMLQMFRRPGPERAARGGESAPAADAADAGVPGTGPAGTGPAGADPDRGTAR
jgi:NAD(P) transhydrogenase subunit alpha